MKNYKIDASLLPKVWVTWMSKEGRIWMNDNGKRKKCPEPWMTYHDEHDIHRWSRDIGTIGCSYLKRNNDKLWVNSGSQLMFAYAKYHKDIDRLEVAAVQYDTTRGDKKHEWMFAGDRFFIGKDKTVIDQNGEYCRSFYVRKNFLVYNAKNMLCALFRLNVNDKFTQEFKSFIGSNYFVIGNGTSEVIQHPWQMTKWYVTTPKTRTNGKTQQMVDELVAMPLSDITHLSHKYETKIIKNDWGHTETYYPIHFERVDDKWSVLRALVRNEDMELMEIWRVYLGDDGTSKIVSKSGSGWVSSSQPTSGYRKPNYYLVNELEAKEKCNRIKYILPFLNSERSDNIDHMLTMLRFPEIEQLYKMGCNCIASSVVNSSTPKATIKELFGDYYNDKANNVLKKVGMTKYQLDAYENFMRDTSFYCKYRVLRKMREMFGDDLSHIDNVTYDKYFVGFKRMISDFGSVDRVDYLDIDKRKFLKNLIRIGGNNPYIYRVAGDAFTTYSYLNIDNRPTIDWIFDSYSDAVRIHDTVVALKNAQDAEWRTYYNMKEDERRRKEDAHRQKVDEERKCYEYEDEEFIIRLPRDIQEIVNEGTMQHICIGGYTTRHSKGETNLFFLRNKDDETTPFYAIEMSNNKEIVQIHGFGNKWLGNNPEAIPTVVRWLRKNGIHCDDKILTCTAKGYGAIANYVPMPIVD